MQEGAILDRAHMLFERGNYAVSLREFEKLDENELSESTRKQIAQCRDENKKSRALELLKQAKKSLKRKKKAKALDYFKRSYALAPDEQVHNEIAQLEGSLSATTTLASAREAEEAGNFLKAAGHYRQALDTDSTNVVLIVNAASCLVRAGDLKEARACMDTLPSATPKDMPWWETGGVDTKTLYDYGFVEGCLENYARCLNVWLAIAKHSPSTAKQVEEVARMLREKIIECVHQGQGLEKFGQELSALAEHAESTPAMDALKECYRFVRIRQLWEEERYEEFATVLAPWPRSMDEKTLPLYAKSYYQLAKTSPVHLSDFAILWLAALYHPLIFATLGESPEENDAVRKQLLSRARSLLREHADAGIELAQSETAVFDAECDVVSRLAKIAQNDPPLKHVVCPPRYAQRFGLCEVMLDFIQKNKSRFPDLETCLSMGTWYSSAGRSMASLLAGDIAEAFASLPSRQPVCEFAAFGLSKIHYAYLIDCLKAARKYPYDCVPQAIAFLKEHPKHSRELIDQAMQCNNDEALSSYEDVMQLLLEEIHSREIEVALSEIMTRRGIVEYNRDALSSRQLEILLKHALEIDPDNLVAKNTLESTMAELEEMEMGKKLDKGKFKQAFKLAEASPYPIVKECFIENMNELIAQIEEVGACPNAAFLQSKKQLAEEWILRVGASLVRLKNNAGN